MKYDIEKLCSGVFDLLIIGGGIYGATAAWEGISRNLSVALIDRGDFACATSSNSHKIIHGGLRYLQQYDIKRIRESIRELCVLMRIAPHLVHPKPFLMPAYHHGVTGPEVFRMALFLYRVLGTDIFLKSRGGKTVPKGRIVSKEQCIDLFPGVNKDGLTGAGIWYDGQVYNSERLVMSFLESAYDRGACLCNYTEMTGFQRENGSVSGVIAVDKRSGKEIKIKARIVINATGPWIDTVLSKYEAERITTNRKMFSALNIVTRQVTSKYGVALKSRYEDDETVINKGGRMYIISPWKNCSLIGTDQKFFDGDPDEFKITGSQIKKFLAEITSSCPSLKLDVTDVLSYHAGLIPRSRKQAITSDINAEKKYEIVDHEKKDAVKGLISVVGVKYTTARDVSKRVVDLACRKLGRKNSISISHFTPVSGGNIRNVKKELHEILDSKPYGLETDICENLFFNYGLRIEMILKIIGDKRALKRRLSESLPVIEAEVVCSLKSGMAVTLEDIVFRRTDLASMGNPGEEVLHRTAKIAARYCGWNSAQIYKEVESVNRRFAFFQQKK